MRFKRSIIASLAPLIGLSGLLVAESADAGVSRRLQSKLGLKLQAKKAPFDTVIVDQIEKEPSEN